MQRRPIRSTSLKAVGYDATTETLEIEYRHGSLVRYTGVPAALYEALLQVPGKAMFVEQVIERSGYGRQQVRGS
ncbi:KTSC domain-containing protein [Hymenobacter taeanensis]|uniref:KTSC domain-containing protein n=1 Tax=Hymenobacter taeanensis TaxID=2735321 RepID=A0A6M6BKU3_9BACT|nr:MULTISPECIES: KTSC domain-containing protein [Hymenobacter]QJX48063.1 KTSC domain-containing protein [Hymenobacter taeanensis]UOQ82484.1 KTSC domain-containing protein [Hymenobacter sp. 5414T-23]